MRYKCGNCYSIVEENACPCCGADPLKIMCLEDHLCTCIDDVSDGVRYCPKCGDAICPCGSHDVVQVSRVTGYLSDVSGWNQAKRAELRDRQRINIT